MSTALDHRTLYRYYLNTFYRPLFYVAGSILSALKKGRLRTPGFGGFIFLNRVILKRLLLQSIVLKRKASKYTSKESRIVYVHSKKLLFSYRKLFSTLEKNNFFNNDETEKIAEETLSNFYDLESILRNKAYENEPVNSDNKALTEFASDVSLLSLEDK